MEKKILLLDTTKEQYGREVILQLDHSGSTSSFEYCYTGTKKISHCIGCNHCWLKTPGICSIKDDYEPILKKMVKSDQVWLITDTRFGFVSASTKNIIDRMMPLVTMYLHMQGKQMRHVIRYDHDPDIGLIFVGEGEQKYLNTWLKRVALNFGSASLGAYPYEQKEVAIRCM